MSDKNLFPVRPGRPGHSLPMSTRVLAGFVAAAGLTIAGYHAGSDTAAPQELGRGMTASAGDTAGSKNSGAGGTSKASQNTGSPAADSIARGQRLLAQYQCGSCHSIPDVPASRRFNGPTLEAFGKRSYIAGHLPNRSDTLAQWIMSPQSLVPDSPMPNMGVSVADARDMAAYLGALQ